MTNKHRFIISFLIGLQVLSVSVAEPLVIPDPTNYPSLSTKKMGHVRHMINLAKQLDGDFSMMGETDPVFSMIKIAG